MRKSIILGTAVLSSAVACVDNKDPKPNVIVILMDDMGYGDIGCYGQEKIETPNIDNLCKQGIHFTQSYSGSPVSAPARCVMMTGLHTGHSQIRRNEEMAFRGATSDHDSMYVHPSLEGQAPLEKGTFTIGQLMRNAGYTTGLFGKWGLGYPGSEGTPNKQGFDEFYGYNCQRQAHTFYPAFLYHNEEREYLNNKVINPHLVKLAEGEDPYDPENYYKHYQNDYANDKIFDHLMSFVDDNSGKPFFLMFTTPLPHVSLMAPQRWVDYYVEKFGDEEPYTGARGYQICRYPHATYAAMISYFDEQVGQLVDKLKDKGIYDNTIIIFTSDNGPSFNGGTDSPWFNSGGPFKSEYGWGKCFVHEGGIRVPMIAVWNGHIAAESVSDHMTSFQDFMPTLAELTGQECPETDGISFLPTLLGEPQKQAVHEYLYWEYPDKAVGNKAIRKGPWKGIITNISKGNTQMELYNLNTDPQELIDVSSDHPEIVEEFYRLMDESHTPPKSFDKFGDIQ